MIIIGVDPGSIVTGYGVVERRGARLVHLAAGVIAGDASAPLWERLRTIHDGLSQVIRSHRPTAMAVEDVFSKHPRSALKLGQARGIALLCGAQAELEIGSYPPAVVKRSIAGRGAASKEQLGRIIGALLALQDLPPTDATDALAIAITHANATRLLAAQKRAR